MNITINNVKIAFELKIIIVVLAILLSLINHFNLDFYFANLIYEPTNSWIY